MRARACSADPPSAGARAHGKSVHSGEVSRQPMCIWYALAASALPRSSSVSRAERKPSEMLPIDILPICAMKRRMAPGLYLSAPSLLTSAPMKAGAHTGFPDEQMRPLVFAPEVPLSHPVF